jgi:polysaccharide pyruvyl transferase WcaK-like protein
MNETTFVSVRNDGAILQISDLCGAEATTHVTDLPDAAFFLGDRFVSNEGDTIIGVNLACDMPELRYARGDSSCFLDAVASAMTFVRDYVPDVRFRMFAHVFSDYAILADLLGRLPDAVRRESVEVYGYAPNNQGALATAAGYAGCSMAIGTRFHSNVVPIGLGIPSLGLDTYPQVQRLFTDLDLSDWCIDGHNIDTLATSLVATTRSILESLDGARSRVANVRQVLGQRRATAAQSLRDWLSTNGITD